MEGEDSKVRDQTTEDNAEDLELDDKSADEVRGGSGGDFDPRLIMKRSV